ncbi:MAG: hypothetical protein ABL930_09430 [Pseudobdellovibrio sp.]
MFCFLSAHSQTPIGLYEGLLGNSGAALTDSSAASYYNPSLLKLKKSESYSIGGNTFGSFTSKGNGQTTTSLSIYPSYLSSIFISESLVHEIFLINLTPTKLNTQTNLSNSTTTSVDETNVDINRIIVGYSMAFRNIPFALSYFLQYSQVQEFGFSEFADLTGSLRRTSVSKGKYTSLSAGMSVSGHAHFESYTLGYNLKLRPVMMYKNNEAQIKNYTRGATVPTDYSEETINTEVKTPESLNTVFSIGHAFTSDEHEFITDTQFIEKTDQSFSYSLYQSFGYRFSSSSGHQYLVGISHSIDAQTRYFGQNLYVSTGYSWLNKINRSTFGLYYYQSKISTEVVAAGLTFGSEFSY